MALNLIVLTPVRLFGDGLDACFSNRPEVDSVFVLSDLGGLRERLETNVTEAVLIDVTQGVDLWDVRAIAAEWPAVALIAIGLKEQRQEVIDCGRAGYAGYVSRDSSIDSLCKRLKEIVAGRMTCPPEIVSSLLRALFRSDSRSAAIDPYPELTRRESEVLEFLGGGYSNKEIANELCLSVATVKHHVHNVLEKLNLKRRAQAMRKVRDAPWLGRTAVSGRK